MDKHEKKSEGSVEQNIGENYVPKSKLGNLPVSNQLSEEVKKQMDKTKQDLDKFTKEITKKYKYIEAIGLIPAPASAKIEEEYILGNLEGKDYNPQEIADKKLMHVVIVIPEEHYKEIGKVKLEAIQTAKKINEKLWCHIITPVDVWNLCLDSKFDIVEAFAMSFPILDKGILGALRVSVIHKTLVLKKFEKYVTSYVIAGSLVRGTTNKTSDVDVFIIIDDTDVKKMPRLELKEKLRSIIYSYINEAAAIAGVKNILNVQTYLMTEFWESVKDAQPVIFTFIRDGVPLYDRGAFLPWKSLLRMGKIRPSSEAIDLFMSSGDKLQENVERRMLDIVIIDLYWGVITPSQALLMLYGLPPADVYGTVKQIREVLVEKEGMLEKKYADILEEIAIKYYKGYEHHKVTKVSGAELDKLFADAVAYMKRLKELRVQIEKRVNEKAIDQIYNDIFKMLEATTKKKTETEIIAAFENDFVKTGKFPHRFLDGLRLIAKVKVDFEKIDKVSKKKKDSKDESVIKENIELDKARKISAEIMNSLIEHSQRCDFLSMNRTRFIIKGKDKAAEVFFLEDTFVVEGPKITKIKDSKLVESNTEELKQELMKHQGKESRIDFSALEILKKKFGDFDLIY